MKKENLDKDETSKVIKIRRSLDEGVQEALIAFLKENNDGFTCDEYHHIILCTP